MPSTSDHFTRDDLQSLTDIGFLALSHGLLKPADSIFSAVSALRPDNEAGWVGRAMALLHRGQVGDAVSLLRKAPPTDAVRATLGLALLRQGARAEAEAILADVVATAHHEGPRAMGRDILAARPGD